MSQMAGTRQNGQCLSTGSGPEGKGEDFGQKTGQRCQVHKSSRDNLDFQPLLCPSSVPYTGGVLCTHV